MPKDVRESLGFGRGFDYWEDVWSKDRVELDPRYMEGMLWNLVRGSDQRTRYMTREIEKWITDREDDRPFFLFWNPTNPHNKYRAPRGFRGLEREIEPGMDREATEEVAGWGHCREYVTDELELTDEEMDVVESRYDAEIRYLDHRVGQLIDHLKHQEIYEDTTIVFTSDHGENFGEKGLLYHNFGLNEALTQVPLIIKGKDFEQVSEPVSTIDILNSLHKSTTSNEIDDLSSKPALLGEEENRNFVMAERRTGDDIPYLQDRNDMLPEPYSWYKSGKKTVIDSSEKLVRTEHGDNRTLRLDSDGYHPVESIEDPENLHSVIEKRLSESETRSREVDDEEVKQELEKLGYR